MYSSILGEPRATLDVDIVVKLPMCRLWWSDGEFFIDEISKSSFNVIHLDTMQKVDIFLLSDQPLAQVEMQRRQQLVITQKPERLAWLPSSEDIILQKHGIALVIRFQTGSGVIFLALKVQAYRLDFIT